MNKTYLLAALFAAFSIIFSQISIPVGPVPVNFTHISVFLAAGCLGAKKGALSQLIFVLLGLAGLPVFSGFAGGAGVLLGPTGGFVVGYVVCAFAAGLVIDRCGVEIKYLTLACCIGWVITYICGTAWFMYITHSPLYAALTVCVFPFIISDIFKTVVSIMLIRKIKPLMPNT